MKIKIDKLKTKAELLQFPNTCLEFLYKGLVFVITTSCSKQVFRAVVVSYTIKMMDYPAFRQRFVMGFFPNKAVLQNIAQRVGIWMVGFKNHCVALVSTSAPIPFPMVLTPRFVLKPILRGFNETQTNSLASIPMGQTSLLKDLINSGVLLWVGITKILIYFLHRHLFVPMQIHQDLGGDRRTYVFPTRHILIIPQMPTQSNGRLQCVFV